MGKTKPGLGQRLVSVRPCQWCLNFSVFTNKIKRKKWEKRHYLKGIPPALKINSSYTIIFNTAMKFYWGLRASRDYINLMTRVICGSEKRAVFEMLSVTHKNMGFRGTFWMVLTGRKVNQAFKYWDMPHARSVLMPKRTLRGTRVQSLRHGDMASWFGKRNTWQTLHFVVTKFWMWKKLINSWFTKMFKQ